MNKRYFKGLLIALIALSSCSKLDEKLNGQINNADVSSTGDASTLLSAAYSSLFDPICAPWGIWSLEEVPSDEAIVPTRAGDWDDNGAWRSLHQHTWLPDHVRILEAFRGLTGIVYTAQDVLRFKPTAQQDAEARFIRAFAEFYILDGWGQVPYRDPGEALSKSPRVRKAADEITYLLAELDAITPNLPAATDKFKVSQSAAKTLKMKILLNKAAYLNRQTPAFDNADLQKVVSLADEITNSGQYTLQSNYYDNFGPKNGNLSTENIFTSQNSPGQSHAGISDFAHMTIHYNMLPSGWNGFSTLKAFYGKFEAADQRIGASYAGLTDVTGLRVGFLIGQQKIVQNGVSVNVKDRKGNPLIFDPELSIIETDPNHLERAGIRVVKYAYDQANETATNTLDNDYVHFRYADVLLMKAEALMRMGNVAQALIIVNQVRAKRGASLMTSVTVDTMLDELGREFYWEGHRRTDLIRFGKFLTPWQEKPTDDAKYLLFPIPQNQMGNPNYTQNPGY